MDWRICSRQWRRIGTRHCLQPCEFGQRVLIRNGFVVPSGKVLLVDDVSVDCVIASEILDAEEFLKVGVEVTAYLRIFYPVDACPELSTTMACAPRRITWSAPGPHAGWHLCSSSPGRPTGGS